MRLFFSASLLAICVGLLAAPLQGMPRVAVLELHNDTGKRLARFDTASEDILAAALRNSGCCQVLDRGDVSHRLLSQPIRLHEIYDRLDRAVALGHALQVDYLVTGRALGYAQDGLQHRMEAELVVVNVHDASYAFRQTLEVATRGEADRKQHRPLLDQLAALATPAMVGSLQASVQLADGAPGAASPAPNPSTRRSADPPSIQLSVPPQGPAPPPEPRLQKPSSHQTPSHQTPSHQTPSQPAAPSATVAQSPPPSIPPPAGTLTSASNVKTEEDQEPLQFTLRSRHRGSQDRELEIDIDPGHPFTLWAAQLAGPVLADLSDEERQRLLDTLHITEEQLQQLATPKSLSDHPLEDAWALIEQRRPASARPLLQQALRQALEDGDRRSEARARDGLCEIDMWQAAPQMAAPALAHGWLALELHRRLDDALATSQALRRLVHIYLNLGDATQAARSLEEALGLVRDHQDASWNVERGHLMEISGRLLQVQGDPEAARRKLMGAHDHWRQLGHEVRQAQMLIQLAQLDATLGRIFEADQRLLQVMELYEGLATHVDMEGLLQRVRDTPFSGNAITMGLTSMFAGWASAEGLAPPAWDTAYENIVPRAYETVLADFPLAIETYASHRRTLEAQISTQIQPAGHDAFMAPIRNLPVEALCPLLQRSSILRLRAHLYQQLGREKEAEALRLQAWDVWDATSGRLNQAILERFAPGHGERMRLSMLPDVTVEQARTAGAFPPVSLLEGPCGALDPLRFHLWQGQTLARIGRPKQAQPHLQHTRWSNPYDHAEALIALAETEEALGNVDAALQRYRQALELSDLLLEALQTEPTSYAARLAEAYSTLIRLLLQQGNDAEAFAISERARAYALHRQLAGNPPLRRGATVEDLRAYRALGFRLARLQSSQDLGGPMPAFMGTGPAAPLAALQADLQAQRETLQTQRETLQSRLFRPRFGADAASSRRTADLDDLRAGLASDTSLLVYFVQPQEILAWIVDRDHVHLERLPVSRKQLEDDVTLLLDALSLEQPFEEPSSRLFDALVQPLLPHLRHDDVTVVPHGILHYLPMAALWNDPQERFLLDDLRLTTAPSVTALAHLRKRSQASTGRALVMGNPDGSLDFAEQEAQAVARRLGTQALVRRDASKKRFLEEASRADIIHLAAHGTFDTFNPMQSHLRLASPGGTSEDLTATEIFGLDLEAQLVVLSACQTGLGELTRGDDIVGLNRAFLVAGASSVLTTLWRVEDASTAALMDRFYEQLGQPDIGPAEALQRAQQALRQDERWRHPYFWAGFRLSGDGSALRTPSLR